MRPWGAVTGLLLLWTGEWTGGLGGGSTAYGAVQGVWVWGRKMDALGLCWQVLNVSAGEPRSRLKSYSKEIA